ncbi:MAG: class I SAM-dependent methyltransferase [Pseudomonadota bacterium]
MSNGSTNGENPHCAVCGTSVETGLRPWLKQCGRCGNESSLLADPAWHDGPLLGWDPVSEEFMRPLREQNAALLLGHIARQRQLKDMRVLEVGCAAGWFLTAARDAGMVIEGIEPDDRMADRAADVGIDVVRGYFPECLDPARRYDLICFNDVFEHIPDCRAVLQAVRGALAPDGLLLLNLPCAGGVLYRVARLLARLGDDRTLERLWQKGYESPHLHYFTDRNLRTLVEDAGFKQRDRGSLPSVTLHGLRERVMEGDSFNAVTGTLVYGAVLAGYPLLRFVLPADIMYQLYTADA